MGKQLAIGGVLTQSRMVAENTGGEKKKLRRRKKGSTKAKRDVNRRVKDR